MATLQNIKLNKRKRLNKRFGKSFILIGIVSVSILGYFSYLYWLGPRCTTCFFHFNIDYRLGNEKASENIIEEPYTKLLQMYEKHPNWKFTIECQAAMIERIFEDKEYKEIAKLTVKLVERGQMELICGLQYSQLFYMYPADAIELNLKYAYNTLKEYDLLDYRSRCFLFQEGQYGYGIATAFNTRYADGMDTVLVSAQQIKDFQPPDYGDADYPVFELKNDETDKSIYLLQYDYIPKYEAGYMHSWNYLLDAELGFEADDAKQEFTVDENKLATYEQELLILELEGNKFMTCSEWVKHCEKVDAIGKLDYYIPECNWGTTKYNSSYIWAANNGDSTDDGELLANNYRCRQILLATRAIYDVYESNLSLTQGDKDLIDEKFEEAEKLWLQATCTDATGIGPDAIERITAEGNVYRAEQNCSQILKILADKIPLLNVTKIQVDLDSKAIYTSASEFLQLINVTQTDLDEDELPFDVNAYATLIEGKLKPSLSVSRVKYNASDSSNTTYNLLRLDVIFNGTHDWADDNIQSIHIKFEFSDEDKNFAELMYSPSLLESETKRIYRYNYIYDPLYLFLPLSNGLLFIPDEYTGFKGIAIVKNITCRHTSWLWNYYSLDVLETEGLHMDAHHQFYIMEDVSLDQALDFANRINVSPPWVVSQNVSLIQGHEVYNMYSQMEHKASEGEEGSGEWW